MEERGGTKSQTCSQVAVSSLPALSLRTPLAYTDRFPSCLEPFGRGMFWSRGSGSHPAPPALWQQNKAIPSPSGSWPWAASGPLSSGTAGAGSAPNRGVGAGFVHHLPASCPPGSLVVSFQINAPGGSHLSGDFKCARGGPKQTQKKKEKNKKGLSCNVISRPAPR